MDAEAIRELFAPIGPVRTRRMFGGHGVYADEIFFALEAFGEIWLKADAETRPRFEAAGSTPFTYAKKAGEQTIMSFWRLPEAAYDDADVLREWFDIAMRAARRAAVKPAPKPRRPLAPRRARL